MRILDRYIFREIFGSFFAVTMVLLLILMSNKFSRFLGEAAAGRLPKDTVFELLGYSAVSYLVILIPIGLFIAILLSVGRLYQDSEMSSMQACGVGPWQIYRPIMLLALIASALLYWLSMEVAPWAARQVVEVRNEALAQVQLNQLEPGKFLTADEGKIVFYAEEKNSKDELLNVFLQQSQHSQRAGQADQIGGNPSSDKASRADGQRSLSVRQEVVTARMGYQQETENPEQKIFILQDGQRYQGTPGQKSYEVVKFKEHGIPIRIQTKTAQTLGVEELAKDSLDRTNPEHLAEWQWRISIPLSVLILAFLALPMSKTNPRQGRFGKVAIAILLYIVYSNLLALSKAWLEKGEALAAYGLWWPHVLLITIACFLLWQQYGLRGLFSVYTQPSVEPQET